MKKVNRKESIIVDSITEALIKLMEKKDFNNISICEITEKAGIGRVSFYRNFDSKEDVLKRYAETITNNFFNTTKLDIFNTNIENYLITLFHHLYNHKNFCDLLLKNNMLYIIQNEFKRKFSFKANNSEQYLYIYFLEGGIYNIYNYWITNGYKETPEEIAKLIKKHINKF